MEKPKCRPVRSDPASNEHKLVLLKEGIKQIDELPAKCLEFIKANEIEPVPFSLETNYDNFSANAALRVLLPPAVEVPASFETVGHIAHLNLREEQLPFRKIIGQVLLDVMRECANARMRECANARMRE